MTEDASLRFDSTMGHAWFPMTVSSFGYEYGIIRFNHELMHSRYKILEGVSMNVLLMYLLKFGTKNKSRDGTVSAWRLDIGTADHNHACNSNEKEPFQNFRDKPRQSCGAKDILSFIFFPFKLIANLGEKN